LGSILQVVEDERVNAVGVSLRHVFGRRLLEQRDVAEEAHEVEIADGAQCAGFADAGRLRLLAVPADLFAVVDELGAAEDGGVVVAPLVDVEVQVRR
jgi:hypothetical protein